MYIDYIMYNEGIKKSIYKWRENNKEEWNDYHNLKEKERYNKMKDVIKEKYEYKRFLYNTNPRIEFEFFRRIDL